MFHRVGTIRYMRTGSGTSEINQIFRKIVAQGGVLGLWRGCWPNVQVRDCAASYLSPPASNVPAK